METLGMPYVKQGFHMKDLLSSRPEQKAEEGLISQGSLTGEAPAGIPHDVTALDSYGGYSTGYEIQGNPYYWYRYPNAESYAPRKFQQQRVTLCAGLNKQQ